MKMTDLNNWDNIEITAAIDFLNHPKGRPEMGDMSDCPQWVRLCALNHLTHLQSDEEPEEIEPEIFQARTGYERKMRYKILAAREELWERQDWLKCDAHGYLNERFGSRGGVPDWVAEAAIRDLQQQIFNLSTGQRRNPAERNPL